MKFLQALAEKPWLSTNNLTSNELTIEDTAESFSPLENAKSSPEKTALIFFLSVVSVIFLLFTITFLSRSQSVDFQALAGEPWLPFSQANALWINTGLLILASISLQLCVYFSTQAKSTQANTAQASIAQTKTSQLIIALVFTYLFSAAFLIGQISVWQQLTNNGYAINGNPANSFFYLLTGIHGLHLLGGIFALLRLLWHFWKDVNLRSLNANLRLCAIYWHYLFVVWLGLFALLTASTETYRAIALFCGF